MEQYDARVDAYIAKSAEFAKPILEYIRELAHEASPLIVETIKWGCPFFDHKGPVLSIAAFKQHCGINFWKASLLNDPQKVLRLADGTAGQFGQISSINDLPPKEIMLDFIRQAVALNDTGVQKVKKVPAERAELVIPDYFTEFLAAYPKALQVFYDFSYSGKKEYVEWITDAKTDATRQKRMETAAEWLSEGKSRHWKYK